MKNVLIIAALASTAAATPAYAAGEGRVEARSAILWTDDGDTFVGGVAAGYDLDLGESAFVGPEVSYDTDFNGGDLLNLSLRAGVKAGEKTKLFVAAGYEIADVDELNAAIGIEHKFTDKLFSKVEYRQFFNAGSNLNSAGLTVGVKF